MIALCAIRTAAAQAHAPAYRVSLDAELAGRYAERRSNVQILSSSNPAAPTTNLGGNDWSTAGSARLSLWIDKILDDDSSPQLQPFLQRASALSISAQGGYERTAYINGQEFERQGGGATLAGDFYVTRHFAVWMAVGLDRLSIASSAGNGTYRYTPLDAKGGLALRIGDVRAGLGYHYIGAWASPDRPEGAPSRYLSPGWGALQLDVRAVLGRSLEVTMLAQVWDTTSRSGGGADVGATWFFRRETGVMAGLGGSYGPAPTTEDYSLIHEAWPANGSVAYEGVRWTMGLSHFFTGQFGLSLRYLGWWNHLQLGGSQFTDALGAEVRVLLTARM